MNTALKNIGYCLAITTLLATAAPSADAAGGTVTFAINSIDTSLGGTIRCALYDNEENFLSENPIDTATAVTDKEAVRCTFEGVPKGTYATAALHDEDDDEEMDKILGVPEEGYAVSNDAHRDGITPDWEDARFEHNGRVGRVDASMKY